MKYNILITLGMSFMVASGAFAVTKADCDKKISEVKDRAFVIKDGTYLTTLQLAAITGKYSELKQKLKNMRRQLGVDSAGFESLVKTMEKDSKNTASNKFSTCVNTGQILLNNLIKYKQYAEENTLAASIK